MLILNGSWRKCVLLIAGFRIREQLSTTSKRNSGFQRQQRQHFAKVEPFAALLQIAGRSSDRARKQGQDFLDKIRACVALECATRNVSIANPDLLPSPSVPRRGADVPHTRIAPAVLIAPRIRPPPERNRQRCNAGLVIGVEWIAGAPETRRRSEQSQTQAHQKNLFREDFPHADRPL